MMSSSRPLIENSNLPPRSAGDDLVELHVARARHHVVEAEVALAHRRQDAHRAPTPMPSSPAAVRALLDEVVELRVHAARGRRRRTPAGRSSPRAGTAELGRVVRVARAARALRARRAPGATTSSIRNISCSAPMRRTPVSKRSSASMRSSARRSARIALMNSRCRSPSSLPSTSLCSRVVIGSAPSRSRVHSSRICGNIAPPRHPVVVPLGPPRVDAVRDALRARARSPGSTTRRCPRPGPRPRRCRM